MTDKITHDLSTPHTPGPWRIFGREIRSGDITHVAQIKAGHNIGASPNRDTADANARIIAAAPDMLAALQFLICVDFDNFTEHDELLLETVRRDAKAAIAKATTPRPLTTRMRRQRRP